MIRVARMNVKQLACHPDWRHVRDFPERLEHKTFLYRCQSCGGKAKLFWVDDRVWRLLPVLWRDTILCLRCLAKGIAGKPLRMPPRMRGWALLIAEAKVRDAMRILNGVLTEIELLKGSLAKKKRPTSSR